MKAACWSVSAFSIGYLLVEALRLPTLAYDPLARTVRFTAQVVGLEMRYGGDLLWACAAGGLGAACGHLLAARRPDRPATAAFALASAALAAASCLSRLFVPV